MQSNIGQINSSYVNFEFAEFALSARTIRNAYNFEGSKQLKSWVEGECEDEKTNQCIKWNVK
jgi:hypothetical protein